VKIVTEIPDRPIFISEKYKKQSNGNGRSRKWYGNRKMLVEVEMEMEMEIAVALFRRIHVSTVFAWKIPSEFRMVNGWLISLGNTEAQHGPITQPYVYNFSLHSQSQLVDTTVANSLAGRLADVTETCWLQNLVVVCHRWL
jgi:hypothetical protein